MYDISVVLACNRIDKYTVPAIDSVLASSNVDLELVLVVNGANSNELYSYFISKYSSFENVNVIETPVGQLSFSLNLGVSIANSEYIGRMDADDICKPERFEKQLSYMKDNDIDVLGSDVFLIDADGKVIGERCYPKGGKIDKYLFRGAPFCHPAVVFRKRVLIDIRGYNSGFNSEDYDLWLRLSRNDVRWDNIGQKLMFYRVHSDSSQGSMLAYAEVCSYFLREFLLGRKTRKLMSFLGLSYSMVKFFYARFMR